jgi:hypothetical protein
MQPEGSDESMIIDHVESMTDPKQPYVLSKNQTENVSIKRSVKRMSRKDNTKSKIREKNNKIKQVKDLLRTMSALI